MFPVDPTAGERNVPGRVKVLTGNGVVLRPCLKVHCLTGLAIFMEFGRIPIGRQPMRMSGYELLLTNTTSGNAIALSEPEFLSEPGTYLGHLSVAINTVIS